MVAGGNVEIAQLIEKSTAMLEKLDIGDKTVAMSGASQGKKETVLNHLNITLSGAEWSSIPEDDALSDISDAVYTWTAAAEDAPEQREAYMVHLKNILLLPIGYDFQDCAQTSNLLSVEGIGGKFKFNGTTDVVVAQTKHVVNSAERYHVEVELELKTTSNNNMAKHEPSLIHI